MNKSLFLFAALATVSVASAQSLYNNAAGRGLLETTGLGTDVRGTGGYDSRLQAQQSTFGFGASDTSGFRMADDFTVGAGGWLVTSVNTFQYQTGGFGTPGNAGTINGATVTINANNAGAVGAILFTGTFASAVFTDIYRKTNTAGDDTRQVQKVTTTFNANLAAGSYWLTFSAAGTLASGPWAPMLTAVGQNQVPGSNNGQQFSPTTSTWGAAIDAGSGTQQDFPFYINGQPVPEPATMMALGLGAAALLRRRKKA